MKVISKYLKLNYRPFYTYLLYIPHYVKLVLLVVILKGVFTRCEYMQEATTLTATRRRSRHRPQRVKDAEADADE